jgi:hypothetical protein
MWTASRQCFDRAASGPAPGGWRAIVLLLAVVLAAVPAFFPSARAQSPQPRENMRDAMHQMATDPRLKNLTPKEQMDLLEFVAGNMLYVAFHEMGHALINEMGLPVLGREEDAADSYATLAMLKVGNEFSYNVLFQSARGWFLMDRRERKLGNMLAFYDEHGLDQQRAFEIVCLMVGANLDQFKTLADWVKMPEARQESCLGDYSNAQYSWDLVLKPHRRTAEQPKTQISVTYEEGKGNLDVYARSFRSIRFLETLAELAEDQYVWRRPIGLVMKSCGESGASWSLKTLKETICYEMAEEFVNLYRGYTEKGTTSMSSNELVARNVRRIRISQGMSMDNVASDAKLPMAWVSRMERGMENASVAQLEQLARALKVEPAEFFARPASDKTPDRTVRSTRSSRQ